LGKKDFIAYLSVETINKKAIDALIDYVMNCKYFNFFESNKDLYHIKYRAVSLLKEKFPTKYEMLRIPVLWERGNDLDIHIDVPMHLLFPGITKSLVHMIQAWCAFMGSTNYFTHHATGVLQSFNELGLSWIVCVPYTRAKLGRWISENYLSLARLSCWFYSKLSTVVTDIKFIEPKTPQKDWTMKQNIGWLKVRELSRGVSSLNAKDLGALVEKYMNQSGGPPTIKKDIGGNIENIEHLVESFSSMISACMQSQYCKRDVELLDLKIKVFCQTMPHLIMP
jgi:hypothetical protein